MDITSADAEMPTIEVSRADSAAVTPANGRLVTVPAVTEGDRTRHIWTFARDDTGDAWAGTWTRANDHHPPTRALAAWNGLQSRCRRLSAEHLEVRRYDVRVAGADAFAQGLPHGLRPGW